MIFTQIISAMTVTLCMLIDSIMIGKFLGVDSMAAYGFSNPALLIFVAVGTMISAGIQVVCGKSMGNADMDSTNRHYSTSLVMTVFFAILGALIFIAFLNPITTLLGAGANSPDNPVFNLTKDYLYGFIIGAPAFMFAQIMIPYLQIAGGRTRLVISVIVMTITDVIFDLLNVYVFHGGTFGMGLASSLSYYFALIFGVGFFFKKDCIFKFSFKKVNMKSALQIARAGIPTVINSLCLVFLVFTLNKVLKSAGDNNAVAAYSVINTISNICYCFGSGIGSVVLTLSSIFYGEENRQQLHDLIKSTARTALLIHSVLIIFLLLFAPYLISLFIATSETAYSLAVTGLRLFSLCLIFSSFNSAYKNYVQGVGHLKMSMLISILQNFLFTALYAILLSHIIGLNGIWLCFALGEFTTNLAALVIVFIFNKRFHISIRTVSLLPDGFGVSSSECFNDTITSPESCVDVSQRAAEFSIENGADDVTAMYISLCIEEVAMFIMEHGFKDGKEHSIEILLFTKNGNRTIRIRDNCNPFDSLQYIKMNDNPDPNQNVGFKSVISKSKSAMYYSALGLNNLNIVL